MKSKPLPVAWTFLLCCMESVFSMTDHELKKLKREELLELLIAQSKENAALRSKLNQAMELLRSRQIAVEKAGSIAEAALQLNGVFEAAQNAAAQYLENIQRLSGEQEKICAHMDSESRAKADQLLAETEAACRRMELETQKKCDAMLAQTKKESDSYWEKVSEKMDAFYAAHADLKELLSITNQRIIER